MQLNNIYNSRINNYIFYLFGNAAIRSIVAFGYFSAIFGFGEPWNINLKHLDQITRDRYSNGIDFTHMINIGRVSLFSAK